MKRPEVIKTVAGIISRSDALTIVEDGYCLTIQDRDGDIYKLDVSPDWDYFSDKREYEKYSE